MKLLKRVVAEKRAIVIPLLLILLANVFVFGAILYPLIRRSEGAIDRAARATDARRAAERDQTAARLLAREDDRRGAVATAGDLVADRHQQCTARPSGSSRTRRSSGHSSGAPPFRSRSR